MRRTTFTLLCALVLLLGHRPAHSQDAYRIRIAWDPNNDLWPGLILMNTGSSPITVTGVQLNSRDDCILKPIDLAKVQSAPNSTERLQLVALTLSSFGSKGVLLDERDPLHPSDGFAITLRVGEQALLAKPARCGGIVRAQVVSREGTMNVQFNKPYTGNR